MLVSKSKIMFVFFLITMLLFVGCAGDDDGNIQEDGTTDDGVVDEDTPEEDTPEDQADEYNIGDTAQTGDIYITVNSVKEVEGDEFNQPEEGNIFYLIDITIENKGDEPFNSSSMLNYSVSDEEGYNYDVDIMASGLGKGQMDGEVAPGKKFRGEHAVQIPKDATGLELAFKPDAFGTGQVIFNLDR